jgi:SAM-dependent methyltransferase
MTCRRGEQNSKDMTPEHGSFRDASNRVFYHHGEVFRSLSTEAAANWHQLGQTAFFRRLMESGAVIGTETESRPAVTALVAGQWAAVLRHERIPFISYPYEWTFGMLKDAAWLHLDILEQALENGWTLKDGSAYNLQWRGQRPVFIDVSSFEPYRDGDSWTGYRQFCMMFIIPLLLKAHRDIQLAPLLRSNLEGVDPEEALKFISMRDIFRRGVFTHLYLHARLQARARRAEARTSAPDAAPAKWPVRQTREMTLRMVQSIKRMVAKLERGRGETAWSAYETTHSYDDVSLTEKKGFVERQVRGRRWRMVYDLGSNTGTFARLCSEHADHVIAVDEDELAVDTLYHRLKTETPDNVTPLVMPLSNVSPDQGWRGRERKSFDERGKPDLILCLALIHHLVITANIPMQDFLQWIRSFDAAVVLEFVGPGDEMTLRLLKNKRNKHPDYTLARFESIVASMFEIADKASLKEGRRHIYFLRPKPVPASSQSAA